MNNWVFALTAMLVYLVLAFVLGLLAGRRRSFWSVSEYAVADRGLGLVVIWFMMGGTVFSAFSFLGGPGMAFSQGAAAFFVPTYVALGILPWYLLGPKVGRIGARKNFFTMGDFLGDRYQSRSLTVIVGVISVLAFIQYLTLQIKGMAFIFNILTDGVIPYWLGALLAYGIVVIYVASSGVRGAAWSDVFQGALMLVVAWTVGFYLVYALQGGPADMFTSISESRPGFLTIGNEGSTMSGMAYTTVILVSALGFLMWPHLFTKSYTTTEKRIKLTTLAFPLFGIFMVPVLFIGFSAIGVVSPDALGSADEILPHLITYELGASGWLYGLIGAGSLAAAMSSSDAITHGGSVSLGRDVLLPLKPDMNERTQIWIMRLGVVAIGAAAYWLSIFGAAGIIALLVGAYGSIAQFVPAVYGALIWRRATKSGAIAGLIVGIAVNYYYQIVADVTPLDMNAGFIGLLCNIVVFVAISMLTRPVPEALADEYRNA
ncbi:sodium:solute symporter family protein [Halomonas caseinilytica]|uniref:Solute:Na+ symporter, SSS family n=1 Tax=Halomonas caseinilytica TaxID=438744 RepID=A0A1M6WN20_9GAMM|nr:sodium:solute symporter family protein [Halomonas caseinilytica]SEM86721.1 solute:Na+ symporter, SSS family [Halomonas caseinilytica]SHK95098.1 solute:Na+ symporter, SSS family [Halomonas caseinilytica]